MTGSRWRKRARLVIEQVVQSNPGVDEKQLRKLISDAYPFGPRAHHPYKIWLSEVASRFPRKQPTPAPTTSGPLFGDEL